MTFFYKSKGEIAGRMFSDMDGDSTEKNSGGGYETGIAGQTVQLFTKSGTLVGTTTTNSTGYYSFGDVSYGEYYVKWDLIHNTDIC